MAAPSSPATSTTGPSTRTTVPAHRHSSSTAGPSDPMQPLDENRERQVDAPPARTRADAADVRRDRARARRRLPASAVPRPRACGARAGTPPGRRAARARRRGRGSGSLVVDGRLRLEDEAAGFGPRQRECPRRLELAGGVSLPPVRSRGAAPSRRGSARDSAAARRSAVLEQRAGLRLGALEERRPQPLDAHAGITTHTSGRSSASAGRERHLGGRREDQQAGVALAPRRRRAARRPRRRPASTWTPASP